jgi:prepilin-type N-terminal cleavage/methylation domain-containing protein
MSLAVSINKMKFIFIKNNKGFTLIELLISVALFSIVVVIAFGAITVTIDVNRKSQTLTTVMNDLNFTLENITRTIKTTQGIKIDEGLYQFQDQRSIPNYVTYRFNSVEGKIEKCESGTDSSCLDADYVSIVSEQIVIEDFYLENIQTDPSTQPRFLMIVKGYAQITPKIKSGFSVQTTVSPRIVNFVETLGTNI